MRKLWHYTNDLVNNPEIVFKRSFQNADQCEAALDVNNLLLKRHAGSWGSNPDLDRRKSLQQNNTKQK